MDAIDMVQIDRIKLQLGQQDPSLKANTELDNQLR